MKFIKTKIFPIFKSKGVSFFGLLAFFLSINLHSEEEDLQKYAMFASNAERPQSANPVSSKLPLKLEEKDRIALIGNTLFDRMRDQNHGGGGFSIVRF